MFWWISWFLAEQMSIQTTWREGSGSYSELTEEKTITVAPDTLGTQQVLPPTR
jgi:hypothetical protein